MTVLSHPSATAAPARRRAIPAGIAIALGSALLISLAAFLADGGLRLERTTYVEIGLVLCGAAACAAALLVSRARAERLHGAWSLAAMAALACLTAVSITWSLAPSDSWLEANRTFAYLATFAGAMGLVRLAPARWDSLLHGIALACVLVSAWALLTKVFPGALAEAETYARLRAPFDYWNAVGLMAALGVPPLLWLGARRTGHPAAAALAAPGITLLVVCLMLSYSRGSLVALLAGLLAWFVVVPLRLRGALVLLAALAGAVPLIAWSFSMTGLTTDELPVAIRADAGHELGALLAIVLVTQLAGSLAVSFWVAERPPGERSKRVAGRILLGLVALVPVAGVLALASAPGGIEGQLSKTWDQMTNPNAPTPANTPGRFAETSSVRARYWAEAFDVHALSPWTGTGAGAYATVRSRIRTDTLAVRHAHGYIPQTLADLGWLGLAVSLLALGLWGATAMRVTGLRPRDRGLPWDAERVGMVTLVTVVLVFGVHSLVDWSWFIPATAVTGLLAAGWVAGRAPLRDRLTAASAPTTRAGAAAQAGAPLWAPVDLPQAADVAGPGAPRHGELDYLEHRRLPWAPIAGAALIWALALAVSWAALQPVRALHAGGVAIERLDRGELDAAASVAMIAHERNPLSPEPLWELAFVEEQRGRLAAAERAFSDAVAVMPASAETWRRLGRFQLSVLHDPGQALRSFRAAYFLDPRNPESTTDFLQASRDAGVKDPAPPDPEHP